MTAAARVPTTERSPAAGSQPTTGAAHAPAGPELPEPVTQGSPVSQDADVAAPVLRFVDGIPGFGGAHDFTLSDLTEDGTFQLLASMDDPGLSLVVTVPWLFFPDYAPDLPDSDLRSLGIESAGEVAVFCSVIAEEVSEGLILNLRAPFVANHRTLTARQVILEDEDIPLRARFGGEA